jgi:hypothetical protein
MEELHYSMQSSSDVHIYWSKAKPVLCNALDIYFDMSHEPFYGTGLNVMRKIFTKHHLEILIFNHIGPLLNFVYINPQMKLSIYLVNHSIEFVLIRYGRLSLNDVWHFRVSAI